MTRHRLQNADMLADHDLSRSDPLNLKDWRIAESRLYVKKICGLIADQNIDSRARACFLFYDITQI